jgi:hypothetical protein
VEKKTKQKNKQTEKKKKKKKSNEKKMLVAWENYSIFPCLLEY